MLKSTFDIHDPENNGTKWHFKNKSEIENEILTSTKYHNVSLATCYFDFLFLNIVKVLSFNEFELEINKPENLIIKNFNFSFKIFIFVHTKKPTCC